MVKKKLKPKEVRELNLEKQKNAIQQRQKNKISENKNVNNEKEVNIEKVKLKSKTKAVGVKSVLAIGDEKKIVTSFGKGNDADIAYKLSADNIYKVGPETKIFITGEEHGYNVTSGRVKNVEGHIPKLGVRQDLLGLKSELEKEIFGETFNDNIRVQICYAVFDIIKVLATTSAQIVYTLNSLSRKDTEKIDLIGGDLNYKIEFENFGKGIEKQKKKRERFLQFYKNAKENFVYFYDILCNDSQEADENTGTDKITHKYEEKTEEEIYKVFSCVNFLRNSISHFKNENKIFKENYDGIDNVSSTISEIFDDMVKKVNSDFKNEENNLYLFAIAVEANEEDYPKLAERIYRKNIIKVDKNIGFNLKKVREIAYEKNYIENDLENFISFRSKLNKIIDLALIYYFEEPEISKMNDEFVEQLRAGLCQEDKENAYYEYAERLFSCKLIKESMTRIISAFKEKKYITRNKRENIIEIKQKWIDNIKIDNNVSDFSKLMYCLSRFMSGKEINILFTTLINKFQEIGSFNNTVKKLKQVEGIDIKEHKYKEDYRIFSNSKKIADEISIIKSVSKMNKAYNDNYIEKLEKDVLLTLGVESEKVEDVCDDYFACTDKTGLKGFIRNNVIKSGRVGYVLKYIDVSDVYKIMQNKQIVSYVLSRMPEQQIRKYYESIADEFKGFPTLDSMKGKLLKMLTEINFSMLADINVERKKSTPQENVLKEKRKALFSLYYTIVYIFVKNMVQINSRYLLGFYFLERDKNLFCKKLGIDPNNRNKLQQRNYNELTRLFIGDLGEKHKRLSNTACRKLKRYIDEKNYDEMYRAYRNFIEHLNVLGKITKYIDNDLKFDSYFSFFHYVVQSEVYNSLKDRYKNSNNAKKCFKYMEEITKSKENHFLEEKCYSKALLRAMNVPFGYNLARYKNLSYERYFSY